MSNISRAMAISGAERQSGQEAKPAIDSFERRTGNGAKVGPETALMVTTLAPRP